MSSEGTPIDAIDSGEVPNTADAALMQSILRDMNASGAEVDGGSDDRPMPPQQMQQPPPPQFTNMPQQFANMPPMTQMGLPPMPGGFQGNPSMNHMPSFKMEPAGEKRTKKRNIWATILDRIRDPLVVALLVFVVSLPALHTLIGKYATWAFAVGGQLSWLGLLALSAATGLTFGLYKTGTELVGL